MNYSYIEVKAEILEQCRHTHTNIRKYTKNFFSVPVRHDKSLLYFGADKNGVYQVTIRIIPCP
jgi:hypothetical protein